MVNDALLRNELSTLRVALNALQVAFLQFAKENRKELSELKELVKSVSLRLESFGGVDVDSL